MKILQLAPLWESVPPPAYGGTEAVVAVLCEELVRRGHEVTLCAAGDSTTSARLMATYHRSLRTADDLQDRQPYDWMHVALSLKAAGGFDIIHSHAGELAMAMSHLVDVPILTTIHCLITPDTQFVWDRYEGWYNTISHAQRQVMPAMRAASDCGVVYNGVDVNSFPFQGRKEDFLLFLARIAPEKGTHLAIAVARRTGRRLVIAGKVDRADRQYFCDSVQPLIDGDLVRFIGEANATLKRSLYARARCLLLPLCWEEPFGLVMAEAMACGTPVIAFPRGSAPEVVLDGETGFLVPDVDGMVRAVGQVHRIDPRRCRCHVEEMFSAQRMAESYLAAYDRVLDEPAIRERMAPAASPDRGEERPVLAEASQLAEAAARRAGQGPADEHLAVA